MSLVDDQLMPDENVQYCGRMHPIRFVVCIPWIFFGLLFIGLPEHIYGLGLLGVGALFAIAAYVDFSTSFFVITDKRIIIRTGLLRRASIDLFHDKVESVGINQGIGARIFNFGKINVRGVGGTNENFSNLSKPLEFRRQVQMMAQKGTVSAA